MLLTQKAFATETGFESANLGLQCFGGLGYIREWGVEQNVRDARIAMLYEGTTGIQALDLLGRKVLGTGGKMLGEFTDEIDAFCAAAHHDPRMSPFVQPLERLVEEWRRPGWRLLLQRAIFIGPRYTPPGFTSTIYCREHASAWLPSRQAQTA